MNEFVQRAVSRLGVDETSANRAARSVMALLSESMPDEGFECLARSIPGAADAAAPIGEPPRVSTVFGGFSGGLLGQTNADGTMDALAEIVLSGIEAGDVAPFVELLFGFVREKAGDEVLDQVLDAVPELAVHITGGH